MLFLTAAKFMQRWWCISSDSIQVQQNHTKGSFSKLFPFFEHIFFSTTCLESIFSSEQRILGIVNFKTLKEKFACHLFRPSCVYFILHLHNFWRTFFKNRMHSLEYKTEINKLTKMIWIMWYLTYKNSRFFFLSGKKAITLLT